MHYFIEFRPPRIAITFVALAAVLNLWLPFTLHAHLLLAASITALTGFSLMLRAWWLFRRANTAICPTETANVLLSHDVYALTRNPMYLGMLLMLVGLAMANGSAVFYIAAAAYAVVIDRVFVRHEEQKSLQEFGAEYIAYTQQVRRWL